MGCRFRLGEDYLQDLTEDIIFRTPGLRPDVPEIAAAVARGSVLTSEMEAFFEVCPCHMIAITGSDGSAVYSGTALCNANFVFFSSPEPTADGSYTLTAGDTSLTATAQTGSISSGGMGGPGNGGQRPGDRDGGQQAPDFSRGGQPPERPGSQQSGTAQNS